MRIRPGQRFIVLVRAAEYKNSPEARMWLAVIYHAIADLTHSRYHDESDRFIRSKRFRTICDFVGLNPDFALDIIYQKEPKYATGH